MVTARLDAATETGGDALDRLVHYTCPTLPHFIALLCRSTDSCIPPEAPLVVVDGLSGLLNHSLPRIQPQGSAKAAGKGPSLGARRLQILQYIVTALKKLAVNRGIAIVILSQCATKMQAEGRATLLPAVNAGVWEQGIPNRVVLYRDFVRQHDKTTALHFAAVEKKNGQASSMSALFGEAATFDVQPVRLDLYITLLIHTVNLASRPGWSKRALTPGRLISPVQRESWTKPTLRPLILMKRITDGKMTARNRCPHCRLSGTAARIKL